MRKILIVAFVSLAALAVVVGSALGGYGSPPSRAPDSAAVPVLGKAKITMLQGITQAAKSGAVIEAKFEVDSGVLNLSTYVAPKGFDVFKELAGPATGASWKPDAATISARGDLVNSTVDLTVLDQGSIDLGTAVQRALAKQPGTAYWAVPTLNGKQPAVGVYIRSSDGKSHHLLIPLN